MLFLASDHRGFKTKEKIAKYFKESDIEFMNVGPDEFVETDDYPDYIIPAMREMQKDLENNRAIILCGNGVGVSILANKFKGIKCSLCFNEQHAVSARNDDDANVLAIPADFVDESVAKTIVHAWLTTPFSRDERHLRRLKKIHDVTHQ